MSDNLSLPAITMSAVSVVMTMLYVGETVVMAVVIIMMESTRKM